jgi:hypothetical protein
MKNLLIISILSCFAGVSYAGNEMANLDDYQYDFSCKDAQKIIDRISIQAKTQADQIAASDLDTNSLFKDFSIELSCEEMQYTEKTWLGKRTRTATKAQLITSLPTCNNVIETYDEKEDVRYLNYSLLPNDLTLNFETKVSLNNINTEQFLSLFREKGMQLKNKVESITFGNFGTIDRHKALSLAFPNCF